MELRYRAFVSYSHSDTPWAKWLHERLENFPLRGLAGKSAALGPVPKTLRPIFRDRHDFSVGHNLTDQTVAALGGSDALIVLCSPASGQSHYVNEEIRLFKSRHPGRPVIPLILDGTPGEAGRECFAPALRFEVDADGAVTDRTSEVLAADVREEGDGKELALAKVVAALIGVPSDEVYRRAERERARHRRIRYIVSAVFAGLCLLAGFIGVQYVQEASLRQEEARLRQDYVNIAERALLPADAEKTTPGIRQRLNGALRFVFDGAKRNERCAQAAELLKAGNAKEAIPLLRQVAEDRTQSAKYRREAFLAAGVIAGMAVGGKLFLGIRHKHEQGAP